VTAPARREVVRTMVTQGLSERRALTVVHMSAAALRYVPRPDPDPSLRDRIVALAHRHRRYGAGMIYLKLRQEGRRVNHKRVDRLYAEERLIKAIMEPDGPFRPVCLARSRANDCGCEEWCALHDSTTLAASRRRAARERRCAGRDHPNEVGMVRPARLERATSWFVGQCRGLDSRVFVPVARGDVAWCGVFGSRLFTDCSLGHCSLGLALFACRPTAKRLS
jgi:hypothetical protein